MGSERNQQGYTEERISGQKKNKRFEWAKDKQTWMVDNCKNCTSKIDDTNIYLMPCNEICKDVYSY